MHSLLTFLRRMVKQHIKEPSHQLRIFPHPHIPPLWVALLVVVVGLYAVIHRVNKARKRREDIHGTAHAQKSLVAEVLDRVGNEEGVVRLNNPNAIIPHVFTLESLDLQ